MIWGGNTQGLALGQRVNFWGSQWASQVTGGDYPGNPGFKGFATPAHTPIGICEPTAHSSGSPLLDQACWTSKPGDSFPPASVAPYIGVIVSTGIAQSGSTIYGNIAAMVVLQVDPTSPYAPDPGHPGFGTVAAVIADGAGLFPTPSPQRALTATAPVFPRLQQGAASVPSVPDAGQPAAVATGNQRFFFYTPELHLQAESELTASAVPAISTEYIWFNEHPVAQSDVTGATSWTFTDHLGTPILQTGAAQGVTWRAEYEPYGAVYTLRSLDQHQPLRLPGQEAEQLNLGANGVTSRSYNIHRWYEAGTGRYSQPDPLALRGGPHLYAYGDENPLLETDELGLETTKACATRFISFFGGVNHVPIVGPWLDKRIGNNLLGFCASCPPKQSPANPRLNPTPPAANGIPDLTVLSPATKDPGVDALRKECKCEGAGKQFYAVNVKTRLALSAGDLETQKLRYSLDYDCKECKPPK